MMFVEFNNLFHLFHLQKKKKKEYKIDAFIL